jgi:hypothetical protein
MGLTMKEKRRLPIKGYDSPYSRGQIELTLTDKEASDKLAIMVEVSSIEEPVGSFARVVELADTPDLGSGAAGLRVQVPSLASFERRGLQGKSLLSQCLKT